MERHFVESYDDEREVLRKIEELRTLGYEESEMYVTARTNEQLTMIRTRTDVDYHAAEEKHMNRFSIFMRGGPVPPCFDDFTEEVKETAFLYQQLSEGKLLLFGNKHTEQAVDEGQVSAAGRADPKALDLLQPDMHMQEEDSVSIDSVHYETVLTQPIRK